MSIAPARARQLRIIAGFSQSALSGVIGCSAATIARFEKGAGQLDDTVNPALATALGCSETLLKRQPPEYSVVGPWLRAYADASKRSVDAYVEESKLVVEMLGALGISRRRDRLPTFDADPADDAAIEDFADAVRAAANIADGAVVGNATRAAERLGCVVLPTDDELGRHLGMSLVIDGVSVIRVARPQIGDGIPGDRQRHTLAHELGHLALHADHPAPASGADTKLLERQAHRFAGAFLTPAEPLLATLDELGDRVTLNTLAHLKQRWGVSIKALVMRFRQLGTIDEAHATSLYKQISSRGWNMSEPVHVGNEGAIWLKQELSRRTEAERGASSWAAAAFGVDSSFIESWTSWEPVVHANVIDLVQHREESSSEGRTPAFGEAPATIAHLPIRRPRK